MGIKKSPFRDWNGVWQVRKQGPEGPVLIGGLDPGLGPVHDLEPALDSILNLALAPLVDLAMDHWLETALTLELDVALVVVLDLIQGLALRHVVDPILHLALEVDANLLLRPALQPVWIEFWIQF